MLQTLEIDSAKCGRTTEDEVYTQWRVARIEVFGFLSVGFFRFLEKVTTEYYGLFRKSPRCQR
jgi:hypothetical protein